MKVSAVAASVLAAASSAAAVSIAEINGDRFLSPFKDKDVTGVKGLVTAVSANGIYLRSTEPDSNPATSEGLYVFNRAVGKQVKVGDVITLDGKVTEYRSNTNFIYLTQLTTPTKVTVISSGNKVTPLVIGVDTSLPPTEEYSSLDAGGVFGVPNNVATISGANPKLDPTKYGLDFWESLVGELVTVKGAYGVGRPNKFGDTWVRGDWKTTGVNKHGGVTMLTGDANPETIVIGSPLDGTKNQADTKMGDFIGDVTGVVYNDFGTYRVLPLTRIAAVKSAPVDHPAVSFTSRGNCSGITVGDYNVENLDPKDAHLPLIVDHIVSKMRTPDLIFLQEVQDDNGAVNDGVVSSNATLGALAAGIEKASGVVYEFAVVDPVNGKDGGEPGGNIRNAYLYRPDVMELYKPKQGGATDANEVLAGPELKFNPGRIDPANPSFADSRKPLIAMWKLTKGPAKRFFTVNVHFGSKGGSSPLTGDLRPPVNKGVEKRQEQAEITANFISQILALDPKANVITAGDWNEFAQVAPITNFASKTGMVDLDEAAKVDPNERYTYSFEQTAQALDHMFVTPGLGRGALYEHLHINSWQTFADQVSDHDPSVARFNMCRCTV